MIEIPVIDFKNDPEIISRFRQVIDCLGKRSEAAKLAGVTEDSIHKYMAGKSVPSIEVVTRICLAAKVSIDWLMTGKTQIGDTSPFYQPDANFSCSYSPGKKVTKGDFVYTQLKSNKVLIGFLEDENKETYKIKPYDETKSVETITIQKSELTTIAPAQIIKALS